MKYLFIIIITIALVVTVFLGMSYLVTPPKKNANPTGNITVNKIDDLKILNIEKLIPVHQQSSYEKIKDMPPIPLALNQSSYSNIVKVKAIDKRYKLPKKLDFSSEECQFCHRVNIH